MDPYYKDYNARKNGTYEKIWLSTGKCVFCDLKDKYIIYEKDGMVLTMNLFPYITGHLLIIPRRHFESFMDINEDEWKTLYHVANVGVKLLRKVMKIEESWVMFRTPKGYKAGKSVNHAHAHILPFETDLVIFNNKEILESPVDTAIKLRENLSHVIK